MLKIIQNFIFFLLFFLFVGCASRPITWQERILKSQPTPLSLAYSEYGTQQSETLLFLHGFGENRQTWRFITPELSKKYHVVTVDFKGFGESPKLDDDAYSVYDQAEFIKAFIEKKNLNNVTVVGRSFGGGVALVLALIQEDNLMGDRIKNLILINSMSYQQRLPSMMETLNTPLIGYLGIHLLSSDKIAEEGYRFAFYNDSLIPKESVAYTSQCLTAPLAKYAYLQTVHQLIPDDIAMMEQRYREIDLPTLILWGREDVSIHVEMAYRLRRTLRNSRLKIFSKVGHMPQEERPDLVIKEIEKFMEERK